MAGTIDSAADRPAGDGPAEEYAVVLVAAHNEADRIAATLSALAGAFPHARIWVADDGSADATAEIAREAGAQVVRSEHVLGKGAAVTQAAHCALEYEDAAGRDSGEAVFVLCDGDLMSSAARLGPLVDTVSEGKAAVAVAVFSTSVGGGFGIALGFARWAIERCCGLRTRAPISGQRALSREALLAVLPLADGYGMEVGMTIDAVRAGHRLVEIELDLAHRVSGRSIGGFVHRGRQLIDFIGVYRDRR